MMEDRIQIFPGFSMVSESPAVSVWCRFGRHGGPGL